MPQTKKKKLGERIVLWLGGILVCAILLGVLLFVLAWQNFLEQEYKAGARGGLSQLAVACGSFFREDGKTDRFLLQNPCSGNSNYTASDSCRLNSYYWYSVKDLGDSKVSFIATRRTQGFKVPWDKRPHKLILTVDYKCGTDFECENWSSDY